MSIYLGPSPYEEECAQVGDLHFTEDHQIELNAFTGQLQRTFIVTKDSNAVQFKKKRESHDFGAYYEITVVPAVLQPQSHSIAYAIEHHVPAQWDVTALQEMIQNTVEKNFGTEDLNGSLSWMKTKVDSIDQGRRLLKLLRKIRDGALCTDADVMHACAPESTPPMANADGLHAFCVLVETQGEDAETLEFECQAEDSAHACEQALNAYPGCAVLMYFQPK